MTTTTAFIAGLATTMSLNGIATIDAGETATLAIPNSGRAVVRIGWPATMTGTTATFLVQAFPKSGEVDDADFKSLVDKAGAAISYVVTDNSIVEVPELSGCFAFKIVSGSTEGTARTIQIACRGDNPVPFERADTGVEPGDFAAPALVLGTSNVAGNTGKVLATNSTILAFDATAATTLANPNTAAAGSATVTARRDHAHGVPAAATPGTQANPTTAAGGAGTGFAKDTHLHGIPTPVTPSTQAFGDAATSGAGTGFATDTHKHAMPANPAVTPAVLPALVPFWAGAPGAVVAAPGTVTANRAYLMPLQPVTVATALTTILFQIGTQNGNLDVGIYSTTDWATFTRVASSGATACPASGFRNAIAVAANLVPGTQYLLAFATDSASLSIGGWSADNGNGILLSEVAYIKATSYPLPTSLTGMTDVAANTTIPLLMGAVTNGQGI